MQLSLSELKDLIFNAGLGANFTAGTCEDISLSVANLESLNINGGREFLYAISCKRHSIKNFEIKDKEAKVEFGRALFEGIYAVDLLISEKVNTIVFKKFDCPMLLLGLGHNYYNSSFIIYYCSKIIGGIKGGKIFWDKDFKLRNCSIKIIKSNEILGQYSELKDRIDLTQSTFKKLNKLAAKMLVPESEHSRTNGAGAGIIDND